MKYWWTSGSYSWSMRGSRIRRDLRQIHWFDGAPSPAVSRTCEVRTTMKSSWNVWLAVLKFASNAVMSGTVKTLPASNTCTHSSKAGRAKTKTMCLSAHAAGLRSRRIKAAITWRVHIAGMSFVGLVGRVPLLPKDTLLEMAAGSAKWTNQLGRATT